MSKFPLLAIYRIIAYILAVIVAILGIVTAQASGQLFGYNAQGSRDIAFITTAFPFFVVAVILVVSAEVIRLFVSMEDHLEHIRFASERQPVQVSSNVPSMASFGSSSKTAYTNPPPPRAVNYTPDEAVVRVRAKISTTIRSKPEYEAAASSQLSSGQTIPTYGRTDDNGWLSISRQGKMWLDAADVEIIEGYLSNLPVVEPA